MGKHTQLNQDKFQQLRGLVGQLKWASSQRRTYIAWSACKISLALKNATIKRFNPSKQAFRQDIKPCSIICFLMLHLQI